jgi:ketosteroid isomerase-like protein
MGVVLLLSAALLSGCLGGAGGSHAVNDEQRIHSVLNAYEAAMKAKDAKRLADLVILPVYVGGEYLNREQLIAYLEFGFLLITEVQEFRVTDRSVRINGNEAIVEGVIRSRATILGEVVEDVQEVVFELKKVGGAWKFVSL